MLTQLSELLEGENNKLDHLIETIDVHQSKIESLNKKMSNVYPVIPYICTWILVAVALTLIALFAK